MEKYCCTVMFVVFSVLGLQNVFAADTVVVRKDFRLDLLTRKQVEYNQHAALLTKDGLYKGFRIQLLSTTRRDDAFNLRTELLRKFPGEKTYVVYQAPSFKVRIGNFLKMEDAEALKTALNKIYPRGAYIVEDGIEYTPKDETDTLTQ